MTDATTIEITAIRPAADWTDAYSAWSADRTERAERYDREGWNGRDLADSDDVGVDLARAAAEIVAAVAAVAELGAHCWLDIAERFTCTEAEPVADLLDVAGAVPWQTFIAAHADSGHEPADSDHRLFVKNQP